MKEAEVQRWWVDKLKKEFGDSIYIHKISSSQYASRKGIADLCMCIYGLYYAIEVKTDIGQLTALQSHEIEKVNKSGGYSIAVYGKDTKVLNAFIKEVKNRV